MNRVERIETVADLVAGVLEASGVEVAFGVISIHNIPILRALRDRGRIRFISARGEAGAANMADAAARVSGRLGVVVTSTGAGAGNAMGGLIEALTAGTPMLHITGQIDRPYLDLNHGYMHEVPAQFEMLQSVSKAAFRIDSPAAASSVLSEAMRIATTAPTGPVSIEIPIDVQSEPIDAPGAPVLEPAAPVVPDDAALDRLAESIRAARRPLLWLGGGARDATEPLRRLADMGIGAVTSTAGRGILPECHPLSLGAFTQAPAVAGFYGTVDLLVVVGSHLRSNDTRNYALDLPARRIRVDADPDSAGRGYTCETFVQGDAKLVAEGLVERLTRRPPSIDPNFAGDLIRARREAQEELRRNLGPYVALDDEVRRVMPRDAIWVRDITLSNSIWANRSPDLATPRQSVYARGGGVGQGLAMAIGAGLAAPGRKVIALAGDGGLLLNLGELSTAAEQQADLVLLVMNDGGYGVIRNIQDAYYGGERFFADIPSPDFCRIADGFGIAYHAIRDLADLPASLDSAIAVAGPAMIEIDITAIGPFGTAFAGPPGMAAGR